MNVIAITDPQAPQLDVYARLTQAQLRSRRRPEDGLFIAESAVVIGHALDAGYQPVSLLMERRQLEGKDRPLAQRVGDVPIYVGEREVLSGITGYALTRGVLCAMRRPALPTVEQVCAGAKRLAVLEGIVDGANVGAIFRCAAALGMDGVLVSPTCIDPLCRRAGEHGHRVPDPLDLHRGEKRGLAPGGAGAAAQAGLCHGGHGPG